MGIPEVPFNTVITSKSVWGDTEIILFTPTHSFSALTSIGNRMPVAPERIKTSSNLISASLTLVYRERGGDTPGRQARNLFSGVALACRRSRIGGSSDSKHPKREGTWTMRGNVPCEFALGYDGTAVLDRLAQVLDPELDEPILD
jgi:hypothetical protein